MEKLQLAITTSPLEELPDLARILGLKQLLVKRDDLLTDDFGGCKVRNLECQLAHALQKNADTLLLPARAGSNAAAAAALFAPRFGLRLRALLQPQAYSAVAHRNLALVQASGAEIVRVAAGASLRIAGQVMTQEIERWGQQRRLHVLPFGGGDVDAAAAHVAAILELREQLSELAVPPPDEIWVAAATFSTAAGLAAGIELAGLPCRLIVIDVVDPPSCDEAAFVQKARAGAERLTGDEISSAALLIDSSRHSIRLAAGPDIGRGDISADLTDHPELLRLGLDPLYSQRAMASLIHEGHRGGSARVLFWNSGNSRPWPAGVARPKLPLSFDDLLTGPRPVG
jgi:1-aminocyclopropane-1-carboxylate deaminase/D-cysteine desulfhydrase-like pyridoxal-dependent ACC family enzyme